MADHLIEGETVIELSLPSAFEHPGWLVGDPHVHAAPSPDGGITMEHRMINMAAVGVQLHFGTDHDHVADYRPLLEPLGLTEWTNTVVATEMSPVLRGHLNLYPLSPRGDLPNGGGWAWWRTPIENTADQFEQLRTRHGGALTSTEGFAIQVNHPTGMGLMDFAGWSPGQIDDPDGWSDDFDAMELLNGNSYADYLPIYFDLVNRGLHVTPTGVSDSHKPFSGSPGLNITYLGTGSSDPRDYTDDALREVFVAGRTIVSRGLFLDLSIDPGSVVTGSQSLEVSAHGASWAAPDRIRLYENGVEIAVVEDTSAVFDLSPSADATYAVSAEGDTSMAPLWSTTPWVMSAVFKVDVNGDGWTPPLPPLVVSAE